MELYLCLRPSQCQRAFNRCRPAIFIRELNHLLSSRCDDGGKYYACGGPCRNLYCSPETDDRVEHGTDSIGKWPSIEDRYRVAHMVPTPGKSRAVCLELQVTDGRALHGDHLRDPNDRFLVRLPAPRCQQRADIRDKF